MKRFLLGLAAGGAAAGATHLFGAPSPWPLLIGLCVAVLVWFGESLFDELF